MLKKNEKNFVLMRNCFLYAIFLLFLHNVFASVPLSGRWKTIDDKTGLVRSIILLDEKNGKLTGKIDKIFYQAHEGPEDLCHLCQGEKHDKKILGMEILEEWSHAPDETCRILDPKNGKIYRCQLHLSSDSKTLSVRGYIGVPLIGRTQIWHKIEL